jgi:hypothetical protein
LSAHLLQPDDTASHLESLLNLWQSEPTIQDNIVEWRHLPARQARYLPIPPDLHPGLVEALHQSGIAQLYLHQRCAWDALQSGNHPVITGLASGKTLFRPSCRMLFKTPGHAPTYPTKLSPRTNLCHQILLSAVTEAPLSPIPFPYFHPLSPATYDGDNLKASPRYRTTPAW